jgi:two-component system, NarL family, sensor histidine kinase DesK
MNAVADRTLHMRSKRPDVPQPLVRLFFLLYALFVFLGPMFARGDASDWVLAGVSIVAFLPLYAAVWWAIDKHRATRALVLSMVIAVYGFALIPFNIGANTYIVYSAALVPFLVRPLPAVGYLGLLAGAVLLESLLLPPPARLWLLVPTTLLIVMIGGSCVFYAEHHRRNALLWRAQEDVTEMATLAERERISRDLHDLLGHTLSLIALKSELASRLADRDPGRAAEEIRDVERVSREALSEVRSAVEGFRGRGFSGELHSAVRVLGASGVHMEASVADVRLAARHEGALALALREAVTNIVRHAQAKTCWIALRADDRHVVLTVRDDGVGGAPRAGYGLTGMRERVAALGGDITIDGTHGMRLDITLPQPAATETAS